MGLKSRLRLLDKPCTFKGFPKNIRVTAPLASPRQGLRSEATHVPRGSEFRHVAEPSDDVVKPMIGPCKLLEVVSLRVSGQGDVALEPLQGALLGIKKPALSTYQGRGPGCGPRRLRIGATLAGGKCRLCPPHSDAPIKAPLVGVVNPIRASSPGRSWPCATSLPRSGARPSGACGSELHPPSGTSTGALPCQWRQ